jgi:hypothetical protein
MKRVFDPVSRPVPDAPVLIISHPGHELRVHHWMERTHPVVCVLTDGSGHHDASRLETTAALVERAGGRPGPIFGPWTDREVYAALMAGDHALFVGLAQELGRALAESGATVVVTDAAEGFNPSHDLCRYVTEIAITLAAAETGRTIAGYDFPLVAAPTSCPADLQSRAVTVELDAAALDRKIAAARNYAELSAEVNRTLAEHGPAAFAIELLRPMTPFDLSPPGSDPTFYEQEGARRVAAGRYHETLRFRDHVLPAATRLRELVGAAVLP